MIASADEIFACITCTAWSEAHLLLRPVIKVLMILLLAYPNSHVLAAFESAHAIFSPSNEVYGLTSRRVVEEGSWIKQ